MRGWDGAEPFFATDFLRVGRMPVARYTGKIPVLLMGRMPMLREGETPSTRGGSHGGLPLRAGGIAT